ncbi:ZinT/AdcA family metal-binding protein [Desulfoluna sp.]|uniref:ZinT/AdcA family metal-binding protein n=1 Tax=Desulfoluna sp. TaxID=2045199 RepID=UPI002617BE9A|nr:ZinT/AdcA family metal-binding protein [Desulfoluna sp.]
MTAIRKKRPFNNLLITTLIILLLTGLYGCGSGDSNDDVIPQEPTTKGSLAAWEGDWKSHYTLMDEKEAQVHFTEMAAEQEGYTAHDIKGVVKDSYHTDFGRLKIKGDTITFYEQDGTTVQCTCEYESLGDGTMSGEPARKFMLKEGSPEAAEKYRHLILQPLDHHKGGEQHLHIRYDKTGFDEIMEGIRNENWWPILTPTKVTDAQSAADYMYTFSKFYTGLLPAESSWPEGILPANRIFSEANAVVQSAEFDSKGNLHVLFLAEVEKSAAVTAKHPAASNGFKLVHGVKGKATGEWSTEDIAGEAGSGERGAAMAIDKNDAIHVVFGYRGQTVANTSLGYLNNSGGAWGTVTWVDGERSSHTNKYENAGDRPSIQIDSQNNIVIAWSAWKKAIRMAVYDGDSWILEDVEMTDASEVIPGHNGLKLQLDSLDNPHIAYKCSDLELITDEAGNTVTAADGHPKVNIAGMHLRYGVKKEGSWAIENVGDAAGWNETFLVTLGFTLANDIPYIMTGYENELDGILNGVKCAKKINDSWATDLIYENPDAYYGFFLMGAKTDGQNRVHLTFCARHHSGEEEGTSDYSHGLMYGLYNGTGWKVVTAAGATPPTPAHPHRHHSTDAPAPGIRIGNSSDLAIDSENNPAIIYRGAYESGCKAPYAIGGLYERYKTIVFVKAGTDHPGTGSSARPFRALQHAIDHAIPGDCLHVAAGTYKENIRLEEGISLYGGYHSLYWSDRNNLDRANETYKTVIRGTDRYAVEAGGGITRNTVIDGFTIIGQDVNQHDHEHIATKHVDPERSWGIHLSADASPVISHNSIYGGLEEGATYTYGIQTTTACSPLIKNNYISGGPGSETCSAILLSANFSGDPRPLIINNVIDGGTGTEASYGISIMISSARILNNTISGGSSGEKSHGIFDVSVFHKNGKPVIENNIIYTTGGDERYGIFFNASSPTCRPESVRNNNIFDCPNGLFRYYDKGEKIAMDVDTLNHSLPGFQSSDNVSVNPMFVSATAPHLQASSPQEVTRGGRDLSAEQIGNDCDDHPRTAPWSIGAYEFDE